MECDSRLNNDFTRGCDAPLQESVRLRANYADAYTAMGVSLKELGRKTEAQACFQVVARLRPGCALSLGNLAGIYYEQVGPRCLTQVSAAVDAKPRSRDPPDVVTFACVAPLNTGATLVLHDRISHQFCHSALHVQMDIEMHATVTPGFLTSARRACWTMRS